MEAFPYLAMVCIWGWSQSFPPVGGVSTSPTVSAKLHVFMFGTALWLLVAQC